MCGENVSEYGGGGGYGGSPPHVRGKRVQKALMAVQARITPACAGKTVGKYALVSP